MTDFWLGQGDTASTLSDTLKDSSGAAVNIQGATVTLTLTPVEGGTPLLDAVTASNDQVTDGSDGSKGKVSYAPQAADTDTPGDFLGRWTVTYGGGEVQSFPNDGYFLVTISPTSPTAEVFASSSELAARLGVDFTASEHVRAARLLALASGVIRDETKQTISRVANDVLTMRSVPGERLRLPQRPIVSVASVTLTPQGGSAETVDASSYYLDGDELVRFGFLGISEHFFQGYTRGWLGPYWTISVTYTHGFDTIPPAVKQACLEMVARVWVNPGNVQQESDAGVLTSYSLTEQPTGLFMTAAEKAAVNRAVRRTSGSITLR